MMLCGLPTLFTLIYFVHDVASRKPDDIDLQHVAGDVAAFVFLKLYAVLTCSGFQLFVAQSVQLLADIRDVAHGLAVIVATS